MDIAESLQIVIDLARQAQLDGAQCEGDARLLFEQKRQDDAINMVEDLAVNQFGDD